jgi:predicted house-cleaning NTP pyrophosphatase (Maf/HAM1 superfamily)
VGSNIGISEGRKSRQDLDLTVIGADQLVSFQGQILGKPNTRKNAIITVRKNAKSNP